MVRSKNRSGSGDNRAPSSHAVPIPGSGPSRRPPPLTGDGQNPTASQPPFSSTSAQRAPPSVPLGVSPPMISASGTSTATAGSSGESSHGASSSSAAALTGDMKKLTLLPSNPPAHPPSSSKALKVPQRPGFGKSGQKCVVRANHFLVEVASKSYFHYDVAITPEVTSKAVNRHIIKELVRLYKLSHLGNRMPAYDGKKSLYTAGPLPFDSKEFKIILVDTKEDSKDGSSSKSKGRERQFKVTIRYAAKGDLDHLKRFLEGRQLDCPQETIQVLDVVLRTVPSAEYSVVGRSFFHTDFGKGDLGDGLVYWKGYYQSLRATQHGLSLNIDLSATAFYDTIDVIDFVSKNINLGRNFERLMRPLQDHDCVKLKRALKGRRVKATHVQNSRSYKITGLSSQPVNRAMFSLDEQKTQISVFEYFKQKYNIVLKYPALPALQAGTDARPIYLPMELCEIVAGQKFAKKLNEKQVTNLLRATCQRPTVRENNIKAVVQKAFGDRQGNRDDDGRDSLVKTEFGISVKPDPVVIEARVLPAPMLLYNRTGREPTVDPRVGQWNMINKKLFDGGRVDAWACICFSNRIHEDITREFCRQLVDMCTSKGMVFNRQPVIPIRKCNPNQIEKALVDVHQETTTTLANYPKGAPKQIQLLIIILPDMTGSYGRIKRVCETELGIVSQCCQPSKASQLSKQYMENVTLKINVKVGGRNTVLNDAISRRIPRVSDVPTIIFGADVTHPAPGDDTNPSIAAVVASMDWPEICKYRGLVSAQGHRDEIIQDLYKAVPDQKGSISHKGMIRELLISFRRSTNRKPERIIFYRDGVSDGQFSQVLLYEMDAIRKACASLEVGYLPPVTFIVVQKRHHTRFFPQEGSRMVDKSGNIMPGTVVDTNICHPSEFDFYLNSHAGIQGTSRPAHYQVLFDENNFSADNLQILTNALCFTFARCTRSVSVVPPAYYAHLAAFRARYYIEGDETSDGRSSASGGGGGRLARGAATAQVEVRKLPAIKDTVKDVMFYC